MKSRLSSKIWTLVLANTVVLLAVLGFAYSAGRQSGGASIFDFGELPAGASGAVMIALALAVAGALFLAWQLGSGLIKPVQQLAEFSEPFYQHQVRLRFPRTPLSHRSRHPLSRARRSSSSIMAKRTPQFRSTRTG